MRLKRNSLGLTSGFSLISALIALMVISISLMAVQSLLSVMFKSSAHTDTKFEIRNLADTLKLEVNCAQSFTMIPAFDASKDCSPTSPRPITLKEAGGKALTGALVSGNFDPSQAATDTSITGAGLLGGWYVRAYCDSPDANLVIRAAKVKSANSPSSVTFFQDPLSKRDYDWGNSGHNPLYGTPDRRICKGGAPASGPGSSSPTDFCYAAAGYRWAVPSCEKGYYLKATIKETNDNWDGYGGVCCYTGEGADPRMTPGMKAALASPTRDASGRKWSILAFTVGMGYNQIANLCTVNPAAFGMGHTVTCPPPDLMN